MGDRADLDELDGLHAKATNSPWVPERTECGNAWFERHTADGSFPVESRGTIFALGVAVAAAERREDAALISALVTAYPSMSRELRSSRSRLDNLRACVASAAYRLDPLVSNGPLSSVLAALNQCLIDDDRAAEDNR